MPSPRPARRELLLLGALLLGALLLRLAWLGSFPANITADEADNLVVIYQILYGNGAGLFGLDWKPNPVLSLQLAAPFVAAFPLGAFGVRLPSALLSVAALVPLWALYRRAVGWPAALLALALLSSSVWYLNFSRSGWENVYVVPLAAFALWFLVRALEGGAWRHWAFAGAVAALGLYAYFAGRAILPALLLTAPAALWVHRRRWRSVLAGYALLAVVAVALFVPQLPAIRQGPELFNVRAERVSALRAGQTPDGYFGAHGDVEVLLYQAMRNARFFWDGSALAGPAYSPPEQLLQDTRPRYAPWGQPLLDPATALLFAGGMLLALRRPVRHAAWWALLLAPWALTQLLTINTPDAARGIGMLPAIYFFVALALDRLWRLGATARTAGGATAASPPQTGSGQGDPPRPAETRGGAEAPVGAAAVPPAEGRAAETREAAPLSNTATPGGETPSQGAGKDGAAPSGTGGGDGATATEPAGDPATRPPTAPGLVGERPRPEASTTAADASGRLAAAVRPALVGLVLTTAALTAATYVRWAGSAELLYAREPAVPIEQAAAWSALQIARARANQPLLPVSVWQQLYRSR